MNNPSRTHDLCRLRSTLEAFAIRRWRVSARRMETTGALRSLLGELQAHAARGDYAAFHRLDQRFHRTAVAAAELEPLLQSWDLVAAELEEWVLSVKKSYWPNLMALYREHELLLDAWESADPAAAEQATHQHLEAGWHRRSMADGQGGGDLDPVQRAVSFIATHFAGRLDMEWLASRVSFVSASHLSRLFRRRMGVSPQRYVKQVRLERAAQLLRSAADPVAEVSRQVGYRNVSHFVRDFHRTLGVTPLEYRRRDPERNAAPPESGSAGAHAKCSP